LASRQRMTPPAGGVTFIPSFALYYAQQVALRLSQSPCKPHVMRLLDLA
jgi:hypothetical protein